MMFRSDEILLYFGYGNELSHSGNFPISGHHHRQPETVLRIFEIRELSSPVPDITKGII